MKSSKTRGFTLIELLAIIVILAIIAVITVPIILNVIENAKKGAAVDSAYGYKDAIEKYYLTELSKDSDFGMNGKYTIGEKGKLIGEANEDGTILTHEVSFSGTVPSEGSISIENNTVKTACLVIDEYKIELQNGKFATSGKGVCDSEPGILFGGKVIDGEDLAKLGSSYTGVKAIVYLDPTDLETECDEDLADSTTGTKTGCMRWYVIDVLSDDTTYTMILDHNITDPVAWISLNDYEQGGHETATPESVGISYDNVENMTEDGKLPAGSFILSYLDYIPNNRGPITLLNQLKENTANWTVANTLTSSDTYTASWTLTGSTAYTGQQEYTINYNGYQARLLSGEEINRITGIETNTASDIQSVDFDSNCVYGCSAGTNKYAWLFDNTGYYFDNGDSYDEDDCTRYGCHVGWDGDPMGYWTSSPYRNSAYKAWYVDYFGRVSGDSYLVDVSIYFGIRPVITVSESKLQ